MTPNQEKFKMITESLESLNFLEPENGWWDVYLRKYNVKESSLYIEIQHSSYHDRIEIFFLNKKPIRWAMEFDTFFGMLTEDAKEEVLFNLNLFR